MCPNHHIPCSLKRIQFLRQGKHLPKTYRVRKKVVQKMPWIISWSFWDDRCQQKKKKEIRMKKNLNLAASFFSSYLFGFWLQIIRNYLFRISVPFSYLLWQISQVSKFFTLAIHLSKHLLCRYPTVPEQLHGAGSRFSLDDKQIRQIGFVLDLRSTSTLNLSSCIELFTENLKSWNVFVQIWKCYLDVIFISKCTRA